MNLRIRKLRKTLDLTQAEFAKKLGTTANVLTHYETGRRNPSNSVINNICKTFNVSENWLRTGEGEMLFPKSRSDEISAFVGDILQGEPDFRQRFISVLSRMTTEEWKLLEDKVLELVEEMKKADP